MFKKILCCVLSILCILLCVGCSKNEDGEKMPVTNSVSNAEITEFNVTVNGKNGVEYTYKVTDGSLISEPETPTNRGLIFEGWFLLEGYIYGEKWDFSNDTVTEDITLAAKWKMSDTFFEPDENAKARADGSNVRIMSFNILADFYNNNPGITNRDDLIIDMLDRYLPDVIGMQEVTDKWYEVLNKKFKNYQFVNKDNNKVGKETNYSTIAYNTDKYNVIKFDQIAYTSNDNINCRNITWALFEEKSNGKRFIVTSSHWCLQEYQRMNNANQLKDLVLSLQKEYNVPVFVTGDFNTGESARDYLYLTENSGFKSAKYTAEQKGLVCTTSHRGDGTGSRDDYDSGYWKLGVVSFRLFDETSIDHIFVSPDAKVLYYDTIVDKYILDASDHCPIYTDAKI